ncbi:unnamed protein product [Darwinula stevensoni]|uniref:BTB domain-containing protein n=1 Tax=Darwinula stevensoni TaxID=69355 RepID=A0A7R9A4N8_9CRUS|nr:unnamed protein product [Darwinula stevensoni]CAG0890394.1 unnamed protein product [Darwinula stevensoni]
MECVRTLHKRKMSAHLKEQYSYTCVSFPHMEGISIFSSDGELFRANAALLAVFSAYLRKELIRHHVKSDIVVCLPDIASGPLSCILQFIHSGQMEVEQRQLWDVFDAAQALGIEGFPYSAFLSESPSDKVPEDGMQMETETQELCDETLEHEVPQRPVSNCSSSSNVVDVENCLGTSRVELNELVPNTISAEKQGKNSDHVPACNGVSSSTEASKCSKIPVSLTDNVTSMYKETELNQTELGSDILESQLNDSVCAKNFQKIDHKNPTVATEDTINKVKDDVESGVVLDGGLETSIVDLNELANISVGTEKIKEDRVYDPVSNCGVTSCLDVSDCKISIPMTEKETLNSEKTEMDQTKFTPDILTPQLNHSICTEDSQEIGLNNSMIPAGDEAHKDISDTPQLVVASAEAKSGPEDDEVHVGDGRRKINSELVIHAPENMGNDECGESEKATLESEEANPTEETKDIAVYGGDKENVINQGLSPVIQQRSNDSIVLPVIDKVNGKDPANHVEGSLHQSGGSPTTIGEEGEDRINQEETSLNHESQGRHWKGRKREQLSHSASRSPRAQKMPRQSGPITRNSSRSTRPVTRSSHVTKK